MKQPKKVNKQKNQIIEDADLESLSGGQAATARTAASLRATPERDMRTVRDTAVRETSVRATIKR